MKPQTAICWLAFVTFAILKLTHVIAWSWWIITAPLWLCAVAALVMCLVGVTAIALVVIAKALHSAKL